MHQGNAFVAEAHGPVEPHALAGSFLEGGAIGGDRLLKPRRPALALAECQERVAEIVLGPGPVKWDARAGSFLEGVAIGGDRLLEPRRPALALAERPERVAEIVLGHG